MKPHLLLLPLLLTACSSQVPELIREPPAPSPELAAVATTPADFAGHPARWGGDILSVENRSNDSLIVVLGRQLQKRGRPREESESGGRFLARIDGFADPEVFRTGRLITFYGRIEGEEVRPVGEFLYHYPVLKVESWYLWEPSVEYEPMPYWFYDPWYPYGYTPPYYYR